MPKIERCVSFKFGPVRVDNNKDGWSITGVEGQTYNAYELKILCNMLECAIDEDIAKRGGKLDADEILEREEETIKEGIASCLDIWDDSPDCAHESARSILEDFQDKYPEVFKDDMRSEILAKLRDRLIETRASGYNILEVPLEGKPI